MRGLIQKITSKLYTIMHNGCLKKADIIMFKGLPEPCVDVFCYCTFQELVG